jgi:rhamnose utilization protein RhaD (predicted bifunctional aldolase and dehydrogenase)/NAD(P)-dependent dehydrogenase (short-subunit alcohol dehydrogenase family)
MPGGGNTSTKLVERDHLGRERRVLRVKASGTDLATATAADFTGLYLDEVLVLTGRDDVDDEELMTFLDRCKVEPWSRRPSVESLVHACLSAPHVDHVHSDAICTLTNTAHWREVIAESLGGDVALVDYVRPGFRLAKLVAEVDGAEAIVLRHHGLVTCADSHERTIQLTLELDERARDYVRKRTRRSGSSGAEVSEAELADLLPALRGRLSSSRRQVLHLDRTQLHLANRTDVAAVASAGRATPDHMLRIGSETAVVRPEHWQDDLAAFDQRRDDELRAAPAPAHPAAASVTRTRALLVPGLGCIGVGRNPREAKLHAEVAGHSHQAIADGLDAFGEIVWLDEEQVREFLFWPLELDKLARAAPAQELEGHVALVTGAASGIGREVALHLAQHGAQVVVADIDEAGLADVSEQIGDDASIAVRADLTQETDIDRVVRAAVTAFGGFDAVVSNAGIAVAGKLADLEPEDWERSLRINATSHFLLTRRVWPVLEAQRLGASLVYVASKNAFSPGAGFGAYSAAKAAEIQVARIAALEGGPHGIRSNVVNPDAIFSGSRLWSDEMRRQRASEHGVEPDQLEAFYASRNLLGREVTTGDVAEAVRFLVSPRSAATTGCVLTVDGGVAGAFPR